VPELLVVQISPPYADSVALFSDVKWVLVWVLFTFAVPLIPCTYEYLDQIEGQVSTTAFYLTLATSHNHSPFAYHPSAPIITIISRQPANMDTTQNHTAFFQNKYARACALWEDGKGPNNTQRHAARIDDICAELVGDSDCPRLIQVHALELRSLCTKKYFDGRHYLTQALDILSKIPDELKLEQDDAKLVECRALVVSQWSFQPIL
jgi:hypothetical protein